MKKILFLSVIVLLLDTLKAQNISCKKIFPMPDSVIAGKVFELPGNQYLISDFYSFTKQYDTDFNLTYDYSDFFISVNSLPKIDVFQDKIYTTQGQGNILLKIYDANTHNLVGNYTITPSHSSDNSIIVGKETIVDELGNYYVFVIEQNYFSGTGYIFYHKLYKFDNQLNLLYSKDYNTQSSDGDFGSFKLRIINNKLIISGAVYRNRNFRFNNVNFSSTNYDRIFIFSVDRDTGIIIDTDYLSVGNNGEFLNDFMYNHDTYTYNDVFYLITSEKKPTGGNFLVLRKGEFINNNLVVNWIREVKTTSNFISSLGVTFKDNTLIMAVRANTGSIQNWDNNIHQNNDSDIIWLSTDFNNFHAFVSTSNNFIHRYKLQKINNKLGFLFDVNNDGTVTIDNQSLYMHDGDVAFAYFSDDLGFQDIDFYTQVTPNPTNPHNYVNRGLPIRFKVKVKNELTQNLSALSAVIRSSTPGVSVTDSTASFTAMQAGDATWSSDEFEIIADSTVQPGTLLEFELECSDPLVSGGPWTTYFSFPVAPARTGEVVLIDNQGDNDGIAEPGENDILLQPKIDNVSGNILEEVRGILSCEDAFIDITQDNYLYNVANNVPQPVQPGDTAIVPAFPYRFNYPSTEPFQELNFRLELQSRIDSSSGPLIKWVSGFELNPGVEPPPVIVSTVPADDATDVAVDTNLEIVFSKNVTPVAGKNLYIYNNGNIEQTIPLTGGSVTVNNTTVIIDPPLDLQGGASYFVLIDNGGFVDNQGQAFSGIINQSVWNFTTLQANPPQAPVLQAEVLSENAVQLSWDAQADADSYAIYSCNEQITYGTALTDTLYVIDTLSSSTTYDFIVKAVNSAGYSSPSNCETVTTYCGPSWGDPVIYTTFTRAFCRVTIDGNPAAEHDKVGAFVGTELRGIGDVFIHNDTTYAVINIQGEVVETVRFKVWDVSECAELDVSYTTQTNPAGTIGAAPNYLPIDAASVGIKDAEWMKRIKIYPNPAENVLYVIPEEGIKVYSSRLYDSEGRLIAEISTYPFSMKKLQRGIYYLALYTNIGKGIYKVIKK